MLQVNEIIDKALKAHQGGNLNEAERLYRAALKLKGDNPNVLHFYGLLSHQKGQNEYACELVQKALDINPHDLNCNTNLAIILNSLSRWEKAETACKAALKIDPQHAEAFNNLGRALAGQSKFEDAEFAYKQAILLAPKNAAASNNLGNLYMQRHNYELARASFSEAIEIDKEFMLAYSNLATAYMADNNLALAEQVCHRALDINPGFIPAMHSLAVVLTRKKDLSKAENIFLKIKELDQQHFQATLNLASLYSSQGKLDLANSFFEEAITIEPHNSMVYLNLGVHYSEIGYLDRALNNLRQAIKCDKDNVDAYYALSTSGKISLSPGEITHLENILESDPKISLDHRIKLHFALAVQFERLNEYNQSFDHYENGNRYREEADRKLNSGCYQDFVPEELELYTGYFDKKFFEQWDTQLRNIANFVPSPIFIVGMPRSGTTLIERIIAMDHQVVAGGELSIITNFIKTFILENGGKERFPSSVKLLTLNKLTQWKELFSTQIKNIVGDTAFLIDKTPFNFANLWLIRLLFPNAHIIHCTRDPLDVGLSCYCQNFIEEYSWSNNLENIGKYINGYRDLMDFWNTNLDIPILNVKYENVVNNLEESSRDIFSFLGLKYENDVANFYLNAGQVKTASKWQVREPIYGRSIGRWQKFSTRLKPLADVLN